MPRFLSRSPAAYKKHHKYPTESLLHSRASRYTNFASWFEASCLRDIQKLSSKSLATLSLPGDESNESILSKETARTYSPSSSLEELESSAPSNSNGTDILEDSSWGQFIDPAACCCENKPGRRSKFYPERYTLYTLQEMSSSSLRSDAACCGDEC
mmetsp:Transcript_856/g.1854  ORF Transcript_856/g.1854 Transcript_856/m.1854 type:complete len:156 (-) Transcript_856:120-587(-)|eukprot:scaffold2021_cov176-Amphora_coffeaeformis.AAC.16